LSKALSKSIKAVYTFLFTVKLFSAMFHKHKIASHVPLFVLKLNWPSARFSSNLFSIRPRTFFVKILDACVTMLKVWYSSHFVDLIFFVYITTILFLKMSGIFPVVRMLLIRQYKLCLVSSSSTCSNSASMLSTAYASFAFNSFNAFSSSDFVTFGPSSSGVISSSLYNPSSNILL
jgi:hypothetical protein